MIIGERLRAFREYRALSQVDMEKRTGLFRYYISRVENGRTIPTLETLTRFAQALEVPLFHLVYEEEGPYQPPVPPGIASAHEALANLPRRDLRLLEHFNSLFTQLHGKDRALLVGLARQMIHRVNPPQMRKQAKTYAGRGSKGPRPRALQPSPILRAPKLRKSNPGTEQ